MRKIFRYVLVSLVLLSSVCAYAQSNKWRDIYTAKKKDTIFGIAKKYGISIPELMDANPEMKVEGYELKKGATVFIPFEKTQSVKPTMTAPKENETVPVTSRAIKVGIMLPLHNVDGDGRRMVEYYRGMLLACDELKAQNISTEIHAWNVSIDTDIRQVLLKEGAKDCDIIFGPLYSTQVKYLANFCRTYDIKMVIPFSITGDEVQRNAHVYQVYQSGSALNNKAIKAFLERFPDCHPVFIDCNDSTSNKGIFTFGLRNQLEQKGVKYSITNLKSSEKSFAKAFSKNKQNVVVLNTGRSPELNVALAKLAGLQTSEPQIRISLFGYTEWLMYTKYNIDNFHKFDTYIPSTFYYNPMSSKVQNLEANYRKWFHADMQYALPRFAITGYDQARFFLLGLHKYGKTFTGSKWQQPVTALQTPLRFERQGSGGMQNENFELIHYKRDQSIESITY